MAVDNSMSNSNSLLLVTHHKLAHQTTPHISDTTARNKPATRGGYRSPFVFLSEFSVLTPNESNVQQDVGAWSLANVGDDGEVWALVGLWRHDHLRIRLFRPAQGAG
eukprot:COSAG02_NODE_32362_length_517_cov_1.354067_1_plen_107_part_00